MKDNTPEFSQIKCNWQQIDVHSGHIRREQIRYGDLFKVYRPNELEHTLIPDFYYWFKDPESGRLAFRVSKNYWAVGRKMRVESQLPGIPSGEYVIVMKAKSNSYDQEDFVVVEPVGANVETPRKTLNWLEKQIAALEARDGMTIDKIIEEMNVRG